MAFELTKERRELLKELLIKHGFLIRSIISDLEYQENFKTSKYRIDETTGIKRAVPLSYSGLLWIIEQDEELKKFKEENVDFIYNRLQDSVFGIAEGIQFRTSIPPGTRLEALKFMMRTLKPDNFRGQQDILINNTMPTMFVCDMNASTLEQETVSEFLEHEKN